jgi:hypothetical protein
MQRPQPRKTAANGSASAQIHCDTLLTTAGFIGRVSLWHAVNSLVQSTARLKSIQSVNRELQAGTRRSRGNGSAHAGSGGHSRNCEPRSVLARSASFPPETRSAKPAGRVRCTRGSCESSASKRIEKKNGPSGFAFTRKDSCERPNGPSLVHEGARCSKCVFTRERSCSSRLGKEDEITEGGFGVRSVVNDRSRSRSSCVSACPTADASLEEAVRTLLR